MSSIKVLNKRNSNDGVYIGRPSKWGNPFVIGKDGSRKEVIEKYKKWLFEKPGLVNDAKNELGGKSLVCWCSPEACHGDVLLEIANSEQI